MHGSDGLEIEKAHARKLLRQRLRDRAAADIGTLVKDLDMPRGTLEAELLKLKANGEVEVLRPVGARDGWDVKDPEASPGEAEYYRLRRNTDGDALWELDLMVEHSIDIRLEALLAEQGYAAGETAVADTCRGLGVWEEPAASVLHAALAEAGGVRLTHF